MPTREMLAQRLRETRQESGLTLKEVERLSGFSSTHISEIERGRTTPTVDALVRIAGALQKDPCYFLEDRVLGEVAFAAPDGNGQSVLDGAAELLPLTPGVLGGHLEVARLRAPKRATGAVAAIGVGDLCFYGVVGTVRVTADEVPYEIPAGGSLHARFASPPVIAVEEAPAELLIVRAPVGPSRGGNGGAS